jgi:hypothetical protein
MIRERFFPHTVGIEGRTDPVFRRTHPYILWNVTYSAHRRISFSPITARQKAVFNV